MNMADRQPLIVAEKVNKHFGYFHVIKDVSTRFYQSGVAVIIGASGSGKSTFLRMLNRLETHDSERIVIDGIELNADMKNIDAVRCEVGMVFQSFNLFPHLTVMDNVTLAPRRLRNVTRAQAEVAAKELLAKVGMEAHAHKYPHQLSGGQQQRVAIARSLAYGQVGGFLVGQTWSGRLSWMSTACLKPSISTGQSARLSSASRRFAIPTRPRALVHLPQRWKTRRATCWTIPLLSRQPASPGYPI